MHVILRLSLESFELSPVGSELRVALLILHNVDDVALDLRYFELNMHIHDSSSHQTNSQYHQQQHQLASHRCQRIDNYHLHCNIDLSCFVRQ
ncbi:hypothetical protein D3C76_1369250 [compost metagenome]